MIESQIDQVFDTARVGYQNNEKSLRNHAYPGRLTAVLGVDDGTAALREIATWPGYAPTPLRSLDALAKALGLAEVWYKDEAPRFGLGSFKALGGSYAVRQLLLREIAARAGAPVDEAAFAQGKYAAQAAEITAVTATDGNHGRSVAWGAKRFGCACVIYIHAEVSPGRQAAMEALGAKVIRVEGNYDESVHRAAADADANPGWFVVSDTSYEGYRDLPRQVMAGYTVMISELAEQLPAAAAPSHVFVQGGVGGLAAAVCAPLWQRYGTERPRFVIVEPDRAACLFASAAAGRPTAVAIEEETVMAGLSCGEVSDLAWEVLEACGDDFLTIGDDLVAPSMRALAAGTYGAGPVVAGESAVAGLAGLIAAGRQADLRDRLGLDGESRVLLLGTEGATDPDVYRAIVGKDAEAVMAA